MDFDGAAHVAISMADAEGWNPGLDDAERFLAADPDSFLATEHEGEIVATVSCALYGDSYAFIGFYIVRSDVRGRGVGRGGGSSDWTGCWPKRARTSAVASCSRTATSAGAPSAAAGAPRAWSSCPRCRSNRSSPST